VVITADLDEMRDALLEGERQDAVISPEGAAGTAGRRIRFGSLGEDRG
jgi:hypothetical protein